MKVDRTTLVYKLVDTINHISEEKNPSEEFVKLGEAMATIGRSLRGLTLKQARAVILTVKHMNDSGLMDLKDEEPKKAGIEKEK